MRILVIPDIQAAPGRSQKHLEWLAKYIVKLKPDCVVQLGDLWDIPSLSSYDRGKKAAEGKRLIADFNAGCKAAKTIDDACKKAGVKRKVFVKGNHENRIDRYVNDYPHLEGALPNPMDYMASLGWECYPFLDVAVISGVSFSHFFPRTMQGTVTASSQRNGPSSALAMVKANMKSCVAGHKQGLDSCIFTLDDRRIRGIIAGSFYLHNEKYHPAKGHKYWRGVLVLNRVKNGDFDLTEVSIDYLKEKYN